MRSDGFLRMLLFLCLLGSLVGALGAALISSGSNQLEDLGLAVHQVGLTVMLFGFGGLLMRGRQPRKEAAQPFQWEHIDNRIHIRPESSNQLLLVGEDWKDRNGLSMVHSASLPIKRTRSRTAPVFYLAWLDKCLSLESINRICSLTSLRVLDLTKCSALSHETIIELERIEQIECLMMPKGTAMDSLKRLRIAIPEAFFYMGQGAVLPDRVSAPGSLEDNRQIVEKMVKSRSLETERRSRA